VARREIPIDPEAGPLERFACDLRELRRAAGCPSYRDLAKRAHYSPSALSTAAGGRTLPSKALTLAFVAACGGDAGEWERRWLRTAGEVTAAATADPADPAEAPAVADAAASAAADPPGAIDTDTAIDTGPDAGPWWRRHSIRRRLLASTAATVGALLLAGGVSAMTSPARFAAGAARTNVFDAVAGDDCGQDATHGVTMNTGGADGGSGWSTQIGGDWSGGSCRGNYRDTIASGDPAEAGHDYFTWWFRPTVRAGSCAVRVHIPRDDTARVGGHPAYYAVRAGAARVDVGSFTVDQVAHHGEWVDAGTYRLLGGQLAVVLSDRGPTRDGVAAGALAVHCWAAGGAGAAGLSSPNLSNPPDSRKPDSRIPASASGPGHRFRTDFDNGSTSGWAGFWGTATTSLTANPVYDGTGALLITTSAHMYSAVGTTRDVGGLRPGSTATFHVWTDGVAGGVRPFVQDDRFVVYFPRTDDYPLPARPGWTTLAWPVPDVVVVHAVGLQVTNPTGGRLTIALDALDWPE
jgi:hypothetical protein